MVNASEKSGSDTNNRFAISLVEPSSSVLESWHTPGQGYDISYGYYWGSTNGSGYGYGSVAGNQITISYTIIYTTHTTGSGFYGKLFGNATMNSQTVIYNSSASPTFNVKSRSSSSGSGGGSSNIAPTADAGGPYTGSVGQTIVLSAAGSSDTDGTLNGYKWDFTNDGVYDTDWLTTATTSHSYGSPGTYTVKVMVRDNAGATATATGQVTITGAGKSAPIANANGPYIGLTSAVVHLDGSKSYDPDGNIVNYTWDFGDGSKGYTVSPTHLYPNEGEYTVTLTVKDNDGLTDTVTSSVTVFLDTDGDGWSDILEEAYGTSETNPDDGPTDLDKDGIPDDDSPDGGYIGDPDDDNDGLDDEVEILLGSNPKNPEDVITLQIEGTTYYLIDTDDDGIYDTLYNPYTEESIPITVKEGKLLLDIDNDGVNEYIYDPVSQELAVYTEPKQNEGFPFAFIILLLIGIIIVAIVILFKTGYLYIEDTSNKKK